MAEDEQSGEIWGSEALLDDFDRMQPEHPQAADMDLDRVRRVLDLE